jgi:DNA polymerase-3 subunit delta'
MWKTFGHEQIVGALGRAVVEGRLPHAILLSGPPQVGKRTLALELGAALLCETAIRERPDGAPCYACRGCRLASETKHADLEVVGPGGLCDISEHGTHANARDLRICQVRRLERVIAGHPFEAKWRVVVLEPADAMTTEAANAFLKSLEEPPPSTVFLLVSAAPEEIPETIRSRCQRFELRPLSSAVLAALLEDRGVEAEKAARLARLSVGRPGRALQLQNEPELLDAAVRIKDNSRMLASAPLTERLSYSASLAQRWPTARADVRNELELWEEFWEAVLLAAAGVPECALDPDDAAIARLTAESLTATEVAAFLARLRDARSLLEKNASPRLVLDVLVVTMPRAAAPQAVD